MKKQVITGDKAKEQLLEGAKLLYEAVSTTLGPKGQNAVIEAFGEPIVTHDGVTVAKSIDSVKGISPGARVGIEMIKSSSSKTNDNVGDGTTSSTILAYHLMEAGMDKIRTGKNAMVLRNELDAAANDALAILKDLGEPLKTEKATVEVATISSENKEIGEKIGKMYHKLGKDAMVVVELGTKPKTEYEIVEGYTFDRGLYDPSLVTDSRTQSTTVKNPAVLVAHQTIATQDVAQLVGEAYNAGVNDLVIIAADFKADFIDKVLLTDDDINIICVKAPGFGENRIELMKDIAAFVGTEVVGAKLPKKVSQLKPADLGSCEELVSTLNETVITGGKDITSYVADLKAKLEQAKTDFDKDKIEKRIAQLRAQVGYIRVGGNTEMEAEERKYLVDDAVAATEAALKDGIVPGGGTTYIEIAKRLEELSDGHTLLKEALYAPFKVLMTNAGERYGVKLEELTEFGKGFDVMGSGELVDLKEHGVIDPVLVIRQTITNATSVAGSALTTGVIITRETDDKEKDDE